ncbi:hypothetical protein M0804_002209 [Polistes exclamans]|nr:hypothetical protein M0804_002209 [Polistes exclamans]
MHAIKKLALLPGAFPLLVRSITAVENMSGNQDYKSAKSIYDFTAVSIKGEEVPLSKYENHVCLIVNVASKCGLTATNYKELNELYDEYAESKETGNKNVSVDILKVNQKGDGIDSRNYLETFDLPLPKVQLLIVSYCRLRILAFPCNQFNGQEPGTSDDICSFADRQKVKFDLFEKIDVNGDNTHPLWKYLKKHQGGTFGNFIKWNFTKFIVDKKGQVVERHGPNVDPSSLKENLEKYF